MQTPNEAPQARHSAFAAAFLSFLLPGLGQIYAGRWRRGAFFMVPWLLAVALIAGTAFSMGLKNFGAQFLDTAWLQYALAGITIDLVWRLIAVLDAFWVARAPRGVQDPPLRRLGSAVGLLAIVGVLLVSHATVAKPVYGSYDTLRCATDPDCIDDQPTRRMTRALPRTSPSRRWGPCHRPCRRHRSRRGPRRPPSRAWDPRPTPLPDWTKGRLNVLLVGTNGALTDTLIVVSIDPDTKQVAFIGIPRDTLGFLVPKSLGKAAQYYGGGLPGSRQPDLLLRAREQEPVPGQD